MTIINIWQEIITTALVGTEKQTLSLTINDNQLGKLLNKLNSQLAVNDKAGVLLSAVAAISLYKRSGNLSLKANLIKNLTSIEACEITDLPYCNSRASEYLAWMLKGEHREILREWLTKVKLTGKRVPEKYLPDLLDLGKKESKLQDFILPVLGKRGRWLAKQNPDWTYALEVNSEESWVNGNSQERRLFLKKLRSEDPHQARELIQETFSKENAADRSSFLQTLEIGLSKEDEEFLEKALGDRSKEVKRTAANLLSKLPESKLCQRMIARVQPLLQLQGETINITLPEVCDAEMMRDGIESMNSPGNLSDKSWWLMQMLGAVPLNIWQENWQIKINNLKLLIMAACNSDFSDSLLGGWVLAVQRFRDENWAEALLSAWPNKIDYKQMQLILPVLNIDRQEAFAITVLQRDRQLPAGQRLASKLLYQYKYTWSINLTRAVLDFLVLQITDTSNNYDWEFRSGLKHFACYMNLQILPETSTLVSANLKLNNVWTKEVIDEFINILQFRRDMLAGFEE